MNQLRTLYGANLGHLLASAVGLGLITLGLIGWLAPGADTGDVLRWFADSLVVSQAVFFALRWLGRSRAASGSTDGVPSRGSYIRAALILSGLLLLIFLPLIFRLGSATFGAATGLRPTGYLVRWLIATAVLLAGALLVHAVHVARVRRTQARPSARRHGGR